MSKRKGCSKTSFLKSTKVALLLMLTLMLPALGITVHAQTRSTSQSSTSKAISVPQLQSYYNLPSWWNGYNCDSHNNPNANPNPNSIWRGIQACVPQTGKSNMFPVSFFTGWSQENEFQCTELVKRYLYLVYGLQSMGGTNGNQVVDNYTAKYPNIFHKVVNDANSSNLSNGRLHMTPAEGDVLSYSPVHT